MRKILIINKGDSPVHKFRKSLTNKGFSMINVQNIKAALSILKNDSIDLIIIGGDFVSSVNNSSKFRQMAAYIPKIVLMPKEALKRVEHKFNDGCSVTINEPLKFKAFKHLMDILLNNKSLEVEKRMLQEKLLSSQNELNFFNDMTQLIADTTSLSQILSPMMEKVKAMTRVTAWSLLYNDEPFFDIVKFRTSKKIRKFKFKKGVGIAGWVLENDRPLLVQDVQKNKRYNKEADKFSDLKIFSLICVPLKIKDRIVGVLRLINKKGKHPFTDSDLNLLVNAARYAAMALELAFLSEEIKNDDLTSLYNFRYLHQALDMEIERAERYGSLFSIVFMDLDSFKEVNDKFGHLVGSKLLIETSQILQVNLRKIDVITRYGGDEFVMILPQTTNEACYQVAERLRSTIEKTVFLKNEGYSIRLTASLGIATFPDIAKNKEELIHMADKAMYRGKFYSKNIVFSAS
jgi:diguanylate cyclase (GGDEF)-like protein